MKVLTEEGKKSRALPSLNYPMFRQAHGLIGRDKQALGELIPLWKLATAMVAWSTLCPNYDLI